MCLGVPGRLEDIFEEDGLAMGRVSFAGVKRKICLELVPGVARGDYVLVHVGFAMSRIDPEQAASLLGLLRELEASHPSAEVGELS